LQETNDLGEAMIAAEVALSWQSFRGARGGQGWKSDVTGEVRYQQEKPGEREEGQAPAGTQQPQQQSEPDYIVGFKQIVDLAEKGDANPKYLEKYLTGLPQLPPQDIADLAKRLNITAAYTQDAINKIGAILKGKVEQNAPKTPVARATDALRTFLDEIEHDKVTGGDLEVLLSNINKELSAKEATDLATGLGVFGAKGKKDAIDKIRTVIRNQLAMRQKVVLIRDMGKGGAAFAFDIFNRKAQGILNRALGAANKLRVAARNDLAKAINIDNPPQMARAVVEVIQRYRFDFARLLGATNLAALLEGASEVARRMPSIPIAGVQSPPPPTLSPEEQLALIKRIKKVPAKEREAEIYRLPPDRQKFVRDAIRAEEEGPMVPPPPFTVHPPREDAPEGVIFPIIEEAARLLSEKNVVRREEFYAMDDAARSKAFTVANVDAEETLAKVRDGISENIREGADYETFRENILKEVDEGTFLSEAHLETVYRTNIQTAFSDGQMNVLRHPFIRNGFPYAAYDAIDDDRVRHNHIALEKLGIEGTNIYRIDDPVFQLFRPSWDFNCRCSWNPMTVRMAAEKGVTEAQRWLASGVEPTPPAFVSMPPFQPPPTFKRSLSGMPLSIRVSMMPIELGSRLRPTAKPKSNSDIDEKLWEKINELIPPDWYEAERQATEVLASYGVPTKPEDFPFELGKLGDITVEIVDGNRVMLDHDMDFTQGGNGEEDPKLCGKKTIVLDNRMALPLIREFTYITYHEENEREHMADGWKYDPAHVNSNGKEYFLRKRDEKETGDAEEL
jgi:SPP1 gp7 family putative phage head morphogenesis protein